MLITVIRHLHTEPIGSHHHDIDRALSPTGEALRASLRKCLKNGYDVGYVSPYLRCRQTAEALKDYATSWYEHAELRESAHRGQEERLRGKFLVLPESGFDARDRAVRFLEFLLREKSLVRCESAIVVTHGDMVNALRWAIQGRSLAEYREWFEDKKNFVDFGSTWHFDTKIGSLSRWNVEKLELDLTDDFAPPDNGLFHESVPIRF